MLWSTSVLLTHVSASDALLSKSHSRQLALLQCMHGPVQLTISIQVNSRSEWDLLMATVLAPLVREHGLPQKLLPTMTDSAFHSLAHIIVGQQLSTVVARTIGQRVLAACGVRELGTCFQGIMLPACRSRRYLACVVCAVWHL
jgi:hypothetical protein